MAGRVADKIKSFIAIRLSDVAGSSRDDAILSTSWRFVAIVNTCVFVIVDQDVSREVLSDLPSIHLSEWPMAVVMLLLQPKVFLVIWPCSFFLVWPCLSWFSICKEIARDFYTFMRVIEIFLLGGCIAAICLQVLAWLVFSFAL